MADIDIFSLERKVDANHKTLTISLIALTETLHDITCGKHEGRLERVEAESYRMADAWESMYTSPTSRYIRVENLVFAIMRALSQEQQAQVETQAAQAFQQLLDMRKRGDIPTRQRTSSTIASTLDLAQKLQPETTKMSKTPTGPVMHEIIAGAGTLRTPEKLQKAIHDVESVGYDDQHSPERVSTRQVTRSDIALPYLQVLTDAVRDPNRPDFEQIQKLWQDTQKAMFEFLTVHQVKQSACACPCMNDQCAIGLQNLEHMTSPHAITERARALNELEVAQAEQAYMELDIAMGDLEDDLAASKLKPDLPTCCKCENDGYIETSSFGPLAIFCYNHYREQKELLKRQLTPGTLEYVLATDMAEERGSRAPNVAAEVLPVSQQYQSGPGIFYASEVNAMLREPELTAELVGTGAFGDKHPAAASSPGAEPAAEDPANDAVDEADEPAGDDEDEGEDAASALDTDPDAD